MSLLTSAREPASPGLPGVLRESGFASVRADKQRRLYTVRPERLREVDVWLDRFRAAWESRLDALAVEVGRGKRARRGNPGEK